MLFSCFSQSTTTTTAAALLLLFAASFTAVPALALNICKLQNAPMRELWDRISPLQISSTYTVPRCKRYWGIGIGTKREYAEFMGEDTAARDACKSVLAMYAIGNLIAGGVTQEKCQNALSGFDEQCRQSLTAYDLHSQGMGHKVSPWPSVFPLASITTPATEITHYSVSPLFVDYAAPELNFRTDALGTSTLWTGVFFKRPEKYDCSTFQSNTANPSALTNCGSIYFSLPDLWTNASGTFSFRRDDSKKDLYAIYNADAGFKLRVLPTLWASTSSAGNKFVKLPGGNNNEYAIKTSGCNLPVLYVRAYYSKKAKDDTSVIENKYAAYSTPISSVIANPDLWHGRRRLLQDSTTNGNDADSSWCYEMQYEIFDVGNQAASCLKLPNTPAARKQHNLVAKYQSVAFCTMGQDTVMATSKSFFFNDQFLKSIQDSAYQWAWSSTDYPNTPGTLQACPKPKFRMVSTACQNPYTEACCTSCVAPYIHIVASPVDACYPLCSNNLKRHLIENNQYWGCSLCPAGTRQGKDGTSCKTCAQLGYSNAYLSKSGTCQSCSYLEIARDSYCEFCPAGQHYDETTRTCKTCPPGGYFHGSSGSCRLCSKGSYSSTGVACIPCDANQYSSVDGASACLPCPTGQMSSADHISCSNCIAPLVNAALVVFKGSGQGCELMCNPSTAFSEVSPYLPSDKGGCNLCSQKPPPLGMKRQVQDCSRYDLCTNKPALGASYTLQDPAGQTCPWKCDPGYYQVGASSTECTKCTYQLATNEEFTDACNHACVFSYYKPQSGAAACQKCKNIHATYSEFNIFPRVSDYQDLSASKRPPVFNAALCGYSSPSAAAAQAEESFAQHPFLAFFKQKPYVIEDGTLQKYCGDGLLQQGETCDDGNSISNDGCSASCLYESFSRYDCDELGVPCKPYCGWLDTHIQGRFLLPTPSAMQNCSLHSRYAYDNQPFDQRIAWLTVHFLSCECPYVAQQLLYAECTAENRGCRLCNVGYYHDDAKKSCVRCGADCRLGFRNLSTVDQQHRCGPGIYTSNLASTDEVAYAHDIIASSLSTRPALDAEILRQLSLGCEQCPLPQGTPSSFIKFVHVQQGAPCQYKCRSFMDMLPFEDNPRGFFCRNQVYGGGLSLCNTTCMPCICENDASCSAANVGFYYHTCQPVLGIRQKECDTAALPLNAHWSGGAGYEQPSSCPFSCDFGYQKEEERCEKCDIRTSLTCSPFQVRRLCEAYPTKYYCTSCSLVQKGVALPANERWIANADHSECTTECLDGYYRPYALAPCVLCSQMSCGLGYRFQACSQVEDSKCAVCPNALPSNAAWETEDSCRVACVSGYYALPSSVTTEYGPSVCNPCDMVVCSYNRTRSHDCITPEERAVSPICKPCAPLQNTLTTLLADEANSCRIRCVKNYFLNPLPESTTTTTNSLQAGSATAASLAPLLPLNHVCEPCSASRCPLGTQMICDTSALRCSPCLVSLQPNKMWYAPGSCAQVCSDSSLSVNQITCEPYTVPAPSSDPVSTRDTSARPQRPPASHTELSDGEPSSLIYLI